MEITYSVVGDYLLPDIILQDSMLDDPEPLTKYGIMRRSYLKEHRSILYNTLLLTEKLYPHLREVQQAAHNRLDRIMSEILTFNPPPDKAADGLAWAAHMTEIHRIAERMMLNEIVYV
jgi:hypothetical protein